ncbi:MAG: hypothetical protein K6E62_10165 [Lachnospiraceae bacterium]|nr:hypothetical protein [Lachnospiraceae bacterium]
MKKKKWFLAAGMSLIVCVLLFTILRTVSVLAEDGPKIGGGYAATGDIPGVGYFAQLYDWENGLPTSDANFVLGTSSGYILIGGYSGIIKYDGTAFEQMKPTDIFTNGRAAFEDSRHRIWIGTNDNYVAMIDDTGAQPRHFLARDFTDANGKLRAASSIRAFAEDGSGNIFIGSTDGVAYADSNLNIVLIDDERLNDRTIVDL